MELKKDKINDIIKAIKLIINYSKEIKKLLIYFNSIFWKKTLIAFKEPKEQYFFICFKLRECFIEYSEIINTICDKEKDKNIIKDITDFHKTDEFAPSLNRNIKQFLQNYRGKLKNKEILGYIQNYNPYYREPQYISKRETNILEYLDFKYDFNSIVEEEIKEHEKFIETFHALEYEDMFKDNMVEFIDTLVNKIWDISSFGTINDLIRVDKIKGIIKEYIEKHKNKYEICVNPEIEHSNDNKEKNHIKIIAKFVKMLFEQENNIDFLQKNKKFKKKSFDL